MEWRFDLLSRQIENNFCGHSVAYVRPDRENENRSAAGVSGKSVAYGRAALSTEKIAYGGTDRKFGTWPSSRARSTYYYYTTPGRTCQVFFDGKIKKKSEGFSPRIWQGCRRNAPHSSCNKRPCRSCLGLHCGK